MNYDQLVTEDQRLVILRILHKTIGYKANSSILTKLLDTYGYQLSRDKVKTLMSWLAEQQLVTIEPVSDILIATLTERGSDVAQGRTTVPGVQRPGA